jgi:hypothetical protein
MLMHRSTTVRGLVYGRVATLKHVQRILKSNPNKGVQGLESLLRGTSRAQCAQHLSKATLSSNTSRCILRQIQINDIIDDVSGSYRCSLSMLMV